MKRKVLLFALALLAVSHVSAQVPKEWKGRWRKAYLENAMLPLNLSIQNSLADWHSVNAESAINAAIALEQLTGLSGDSILSEVYPVLYSPMQTSQPLQSTDYYYRNDTLYFANKSLGLKLTLRYNPADSTLKGTFRQGLVRTDITFYPCDTMTTFNRPQTPQVPYSFMAEQIKVKYKDKQGREVVLGGTVAIPTCKPPTKEGYPAVVLVSGSGQQNRDEELFMHKPFLVWAEYLAQRGIATLRYDDRGIGESQGEVMTATTYDYADDAEAMFNYLRKVKKVNAKKVGIMGHSEGGAIAPMIAARNKNVAFVVMLAGPGCLGTDVMIQQNEAILKGQELSDTLVQIRLACMKELLGLAVTGDNAQIEKQVPAILNRYAASLDKEQQRVLGISKNVSYTWVQQLTNPWMNAFLRLDPKSYLPKVKCPLMAINGGKDQQVLPEPNLAAIEALAINSRLRVVDQYPECNHLFQQCATGALSEYLEIEQTVSPLVMKNVADFILMYEVMIKKLAK